MSYAKLDPIKKEKEKIKSALITGITGQDGSYLAEFLLSKGYAVIGMSRRTSTVNFERIAHIQDKITLIQGDLLDQSSLVFILEGQDLLKSSTLIRLRLLFKKPGTQHAPGTSIGYRSY